ncbi:MAG: hypothetical protein AMJ93_10380 [Anaerolineae bacterium SM23_84]|nr:MAG: hypothetical protein AMJ93_10380 [Anaerolineae bacterium SM23_84]
MEIEVLIASDNILCSHRGLHRLECAKSCFKGIFANTEDDMAVVREINALHNELDVDVGVAKRTQHIRSQAASVRGGHDTNLGQALVADYASRSDFGCHRNILLSTTTFGVLTGAFETGLDLPPRAPCDQLHQA